MSQVCEEFHEWVESWVEQEIQKCKQKKCKKWASPQLQMGSLT
jgi:hypothetical protein